MNAKITPRDIFKALNLDEDTMRIITTLFDLVDYIDKVTQFPERKEGDVSKIVSAILLLNDRPAFGSDWDTFLGALPEKIFRA